MDPLNREEGENLKSWALSGHIQEWAKGGGLAKFLCDMAEVYVDVLKDKRTSVVFEVRSSIGDEGALEYFATASLGRQEGLALLTLVGDWCMRELNKVENAFLAKVTLNEKFQSTEQPLMNAADIAQTLGLKAESAVHRLVKEGLFPPHDLKIGKSKKWISETVQAWISQQKRKKE